MKWNAGYLERRRKTWRQRFAIFPVRIHDTWIWLQWYWFKGDMVCCSRARDANERDSNPYSLVLM